jgi:hypothetical protein
MNLSKRGKFLLGSGGAFLLFWAALLLPYEYRYGFVGVVGVLESLIYWWVLGVFRKSLGWSRFFLLILPLSFLLGFLLFAFLLPLSWWMEILMALFFAVVNYVIFLVENVFLYAVEKKTVPLYRAAYTVSLILLLFSSFLLFDGLFSYRFPFFINGLLVFLFSFLLFWYHWWTVSIELSDQFWKNRQTRIWVPSLLMMELAVVLSFWPLSLFLASFYLTAVFYVIVGVLRMDWKDRLFRKVKMEYLWIGLGILLSLFFMARWRG